MNMIVLIRLLLYWIILCLWSIKQNLSAFEGPFYHCRDRVGNVLPHMRCPLFFFWRNVETVQSFQCDDGSWNNSFVFLSLFSEKRFCFTDGSHKSFQLTQEFLLKKISKNPQSKTVRSTPELRLAELFYVKISRELAQILWQ